MTNNKGMVIQFRRGKKTIHEKHFIMDFGAKNREEAGKLVGKEVVWTSPGKRKVMIKGKISSPHGNKGMVRGIFERGLPGQAVTMEVIITGEGKVEKVEKVEKTPKKKVVKKKESKEIKE
ncbi:hypothetical protein COU61_03300 [Candidatus Pacearchaeota archaeon CG10_big_fil_rev_8_21_14_0_10_35_13]|nr:MAG: hypothetical protein COU61_03300 [Candidatus Pacearchaeota archaeon CG10_big_fil_rev_8_21_14_0_10_35_13]